MNQQNFTENQLKKSDFIVQVKRCIHAPILKVWEALTTPEIISKYLFGTQVKTDWKVGSPIIYKGEWQGKKYEDKGTILEFIPMKRIVSTFWSSLSGVPDIPKNYKVVRYEISENKNTVNLTLTQENNVNQAEASHLEQNWKIVLDILKKIVEENG